MLTVSRISDSYIVPFLTKVPVGLVEWVDTPTRLYGIDAVGNVFVFRTPFPASRPASPRHAGRFRWLRRWFS
jgi:hypothetical protein